MCVCVRARVRARACACGCVRAFAFVIVCARACARKIRAWPGLQDLREIYVRLPLVAGRRHDARGGAERACAPRGAEAPYVVMSRRHRSRSRRDFATFPSLRAILPFSGLLLVPPLHVLGSTSPAPRPPFQDSDRTLVRGPR